MSIVTPDPTMNEGSTNTGTRERHVARWSTRGMLIVLGFGLLLLALIIYAVQQTGFGGQVGQTTYDTTGGSGAATDPRSGSTVGGTGGQPGETGAGAVNPVGGGTSGSTSGGTTSGVPAGGSGTAGGFGGGR